MDRESDHCALVYRATFVCWFVTLLSVAPTSWGQSPEAIPCGDGYVFLDGEYVAPPYKVVVQDDELWINGRALPPEYFADLRTGRGDTGRGDTGRGDTVWGDTGRGDTVWGDTDASHGGRYGGERGWRGRRMQGRRSFNPLARVATEIDEVSLGAIAIVYEKQRPLILYPERNGRDLLAALSEGHAIDTPEFYSASEKAIWDRLISEFRPSDAFIDRVRTDVAASDAAAADGDRTTAANLLVTKYSYPLTLFAMVVVVLGFGHLLSNRPELDSQAGESANRQIIVKSLVIIMLLSAIDLIWTIAATNAGTMRELNPLGSRLINDPVRLTLFKFAVVGTSIAILYVLHRRPVAQIASWWCCLLLTLLTARWVVFQSMFL